MVIFEGIASGLAPQDVMIMYTMTQFEPLLQIIISLSSIYYSANFFVEWPLRYQVYWKGFL